MKVFFAVLFLFSSVMAEDPSTRHISKEPVSETELQILQFGDHWSASKVLGRLQVLRKVNGINAVRPALPAIKARLEALQATNETSFLESDMISFLCEFRDTSSQTKRLLIKAVKRGDATAAFGLVKFSSAIDSLTAYLFDTDIALRGTASWTLVRMYRNKPDLFTTAQVDSIRARHLASLKKYSYKGTSLTALGTFGDETTIPVLKDIADSEVSNRRFARWAIAQINAK